MDTAVERDGLAVVVSSCTFFDEGYSLLTEEFAYNYKQIIQ